MDDSKEKRIKKLIEEIITIYDPCVSEAVEECKTVDDVIGYVTVYRKTHGLFNELESSDISAAFDWLESNIFEVDALMLTHDFRFCMSFIALINEAYYYTAVSNLCYKRNEIQELIDLVHGPDAEEDNDIQEKEN